LKNKCQRPKKEVQESIGSVADPEVFVLDPNEILLYFCGKYSFYAIDLLLVHLQWLLFI
jgi:hypothetical protein